MNNTDILSSKIDFTKIQCERKQAEPGFFTLNHKLLYKGGVIAIHPEMNAVKVVFSLSNADSTIFSFEVEGSAIIALKKPLSHAELRNHSTYAICLKECTSSIIEVIASSSAKMGMTPLLLDRKQVDGLAEETAKNLNLQPLEVATQSANQ